PANICVAPFEPATCWDNIGKRFTCPTDSHIYGYKSTGTLYDLYAHLEYLGTGSWQTGTVNPCSSPSTCACFNYQLTGAALGGPGVVDTTAPTVPASLAATAIGTTTIQLSWSASADPGGSGVQSYQLFRSFDAVNFPLTPFTTVAHPNVTMTDTGLGAGTTYYYKVRAIDFSGNLSGFSNIANATTQTVGAGDTTPPREVTGLTGAAGDGTATLTWTDPTDADLAGIQLYRKNGTNIFLRTDPQATQITPDAAPGQQTVTVTGLTNGQVYTFGLFPYDGVPNYASGAFVRVTPQQGGGIQNVQNLSATSGDGQVTLTWVNPADPYTGAMIRRSTTGFPATVTDGTLVADVPKPQTTATATGLTNGTLYYFTAFAHDGTPTYASGEFTQSTPQAGATFNSNITGFTAAFSLTGGADLQWTNPPAATGYTGVLIRRKVNDPTPFSGPNDGQLAADVSQPSTTWHDSTATNTSATYSYAGYAHDVIPNYASGAFAATTPTPSINNVTNFTATGGDGYVLLSWLNPADPYVGVMIRRSTTAYPTSVTDGQLVADIAKPQQSYNDQGLINGTTYYYTAFAHDAVPQYASGVHAQAMPDNAPPLITAVDVPLTFISRIAFRVTWKTNKPSTSVVELGKNPFLYEVGTFSDGVLTTDHDILVPFLPVTLEENTLYHFRVSSHDASGGSTTDIDHQVVTDYLFSPTLRWHGYFDTPSVATWNGSADHTICNNTCNQYYTCTIVKPDCSDARNGGSQNPGASKACGALAIADCADSTADLPQGPNGTLTQQDLNALSRWTLPPQSTYETACTASLHPFGMPYANGSWGITQGVDAGKAEIVGYGGSPPSGSCTQHAEFFVDQARPFVTMAGTP
ncbi:MAG: fibronectin type III domain-containing protein, partial [bacterium]